MQVTKLPYSIITSGQRNLTKRLHCITASHGRLNRIRQVASMWTPSNTHFLQPTRVHVLSGISMGSIVFAQLTVKSPYTLQWATSFSPQNCPFAWGVLSGPPSNNASLGPPESITQMASWSVEPFLHSSWNTAPLFYNWSPIPLSKLPPHRGIWPPCNIWFPWPTQVHTPNNISISLAIFAWLTMVIDRQTDRQTMLLCLWQQAASK